MGSRLTQLDYQQTLNFVTDYFRTRIKLMKNGSSLKNIYMLDSCVANKTTNTKFVNISLKFFPIVLNLFWAGCFDNRTWAKMGANLPPSNLSLE